MNLKTGECNRISSSTCVRPTLAEQPTVTGLKTKVFPPWQKASNRDLLSSLRELYSFRNPQEISAFLKQYPPLITFLEDAYKKITDYFPNGKLFLQVDFDREVPSWEKLAVYISTDLDVDEALDKLYEFLDEWWADACIANSVGSKLFIALDL